MCHSSYENGYFQVANEMFMVKARIFENGYKTYNLMAYYGTLRGTLSTWVGGKSPQKFLI